MTRVYALYPPDTEEKIASKYIRFTIMCGVTPVAPHFFFTSIDKANFEEAINAIEASVDLMSMCDELWCLGDKSSRRYAYERNVFSQKFERPIRFFADEWIENYLKTGGDINGP